MKNYPSKETLKSAKRELLLNRAVEAYKYFHPTALKWLMKRELCKNCDDSNKTVFFMRGVTNLILLTANSDTPYYTVQFDLSSNKPMVMEIPAGKSVVMIMDFNQDFVSNAGLTGEEAGRGGKYLFVPPNYDGEIPSGYIVRRTKSNVFSSLIRVLEPDHENYIKQFRSGFLGEDLTGFEVVSLVDKNINMVPTEQEGNIGFWELIKEAIDQDIYSVQHYPMYGFLENLGISKDKPFNPTPEMREILTEAAEKADMQMFALAFDSDAPERIVWDDKKWEWVVYCPDGGFNEKEFLNVAVRERWFYQACGNTPQMFRRTPGAGSIYWLGIKDKNGEYLSGDHTYKLTVPTPVPANNFWSLTVYDLHTRSIVDTPQNDGAFSSMRHDTTPNEKGEIEIIIGPNKPADENVNWVQTIKGQDWFVFFRLFGPTAAGFDGSWRINDFEKID